MPAKAPPAFADRVLDWWDGHGRKGLPWQLERSPYRVWISEIMLQQTQVATVIPYFERWMRSFSDLATLAAAPLDEVLAHWSGLGYYARARNLHRAARECVDRYGGQLPPNAEELQKLPGIGPSTANAIVSQATDQPAAVLDGNVRRLLARHAAVDGWAGRAAVQRRLWQEAEARLSTTRGADYTQAVMDLGALVCKRAKPDCEACPVSADCRALAQKRTDELPTPKPATRVAETVVHMLILRDASGRVLLEKRPPAGIWGGLWCLPADERVEQIETRLGVDIAAHRPLPRLEHRLSHRRMDIRPLLATARAAGQVKCATESDWFSREQQGGLGLPKPVSDLLARLNNGEFG